MIEYAAGCLMVLLPLDIVWKLCSFCFVDLPDEHFDRIAWIKYPLLIE